MSEQIVMLLAKKMCKLTSSVASNSLDTDFYVKHSRVNFPRKTKHCEVHGFFQEPCLNTSVLLSCSANSMWQWPAIAYCRSGLCSLQQKQHRLWESSTQGRVNEGMCYVINNFGNKAAITFPPKITFSDDLVSWFACDTFTLHHFNQGNFIRICSRQPFIMWLVLE